MFSTPAKIDCDPRYVADLTGWEEGASFDGFAFGTAHCSFYRGHVAWFEVTKKIHADLRRVPAGRRPALGEALDRLRALWEQGPSADALGWAELPTATLWRDKGCETQAA